MAITWNFSEENPQVMSCMLQSGTELDDITAEMIRCNQKEMNCLVPVRFVTENGEVNCLEYHISDMRSLKYYLDNFPINKKRFLEMAEKILRNLECCNHYMIPQEQICLNLDAVYVDLASMKINMFCIPVAEASTEFNLGKFFMEFMESIYLDVDAEQERPYFQALYDSIPEQNVDISVIREKIDIMLNGKRSAVSEEKQLPKDPVCAAQSAAGHTLVDVVQENGQRSVMNTAPSAEKKKGFLGSFSFQGVFSAKGKKDVKSDEESAKKAIGGKEAVIASPVQPDLKDTVNSICIMRSEPDELAYLIYGDKKIPIDAGGSRIGRLDGETQYQINIFLDSIHVSSNHAIIKYDFDNQYYTIKDESSTGTTQNQKRIPKNVPVRLYHNDLLILGDVPCRILLEKNDLSQE